MEQFLNAIGVEPVKVSETPEAYSIRIKDLSQTIEIIKKFIKDYTKDLKLRFLVAKLIEPCPSKAYECYIKRIVSFIRQNVKYVNDPPKLETIQSPIRTLEYGIGDCDDHTILAGTLLRIAGFPVKIALGDINGDGKYEHVFIKVLIPNKGKWITVDTTSKNPFKPKPYPVKEIPLYDEPSTLEKLEEMNGEEVGFILDWIRKILGKDKDKTKKQPQPPKEGKPNLLIPILLTGFIFWLFRR